MSALCSMYSFEGREGKFVFLSVILEYCCLPTTIIITVEKQNAKKK